MSREKRWRVRKRETLGKPSDGVVVQRDAIPGLLDLLVCLSSAPNRTLLKPVAAGACSEGIRKDTGIISWLQWPNLVTIDGKAVGLVSEVPSPDHDVVVLGIKVNCFAPISRAILSRHSASTSVKESLGVEVGIDLLRDRVLDAIDWYSAEWQRGQFAKLVSRIQPSVRWMGDEVRVRTSKGALLAGRASSLAEDGSLILKAPGGAKALLPDEVGYVSPIRQSAVAGPRKNTLL